MMSHVKTKAALLLGILLATLVAIQLLGQGGVPKENPTPEPPAIGRERRPAVQRVPDSVVHLSDIPWEWATTGWVALADDNLPKLNTSFLNGVITIGQRSYDKGLGTFPLSEISYRLEGKYRWFDADIGMDGAASESSGVTFKVFLDDALAYHSDPLVAGMDPVSVRLPVSGVDVMKLVVEDPDEHHSLDYANWANARLTLRRQPAGPPDALSQALEAARSLAAGVPLSPTQSPSANPSQFQRQLQSSREERQRNRSQDWDEIRQRSEQEITDISEAFQETGLPTFEAQALFDAGRRSLVLANGRVAVTLGYGGERHGLLDLVDLETRTLVAFDTTPSLSTADLSTLALSRHTEPVGEGGYRFRRVADPVLGSGMEVTADFLVQGAEVIISPRLTLFDGSSYLTYQMELREAGEDIAVRSFSYFDRLHGGYFVIGEEAGYVTDYSLPRRSEVRDDGVLRQELVGLGKPVLLRDRSRSRGIIMAIIDEVDYPAVFALQVDPGRVSGRLGFEHQVPEDARATRIQTSPRLFFQVTASDTPEEGTLQFRQVMEGLYPPLPLPDWVKYQWGTWYAFYMNYNEDVLREQVDYIAENLADLGPWSILLDAGWYVAEGRPDSGWDNVDQEKFPNGLRAIVDYAHARDIKVVLYFSAPYLDDREREGNWLGLKGFVQEHPDWVIPLQSDSSGSSYVYDFTNPEVVTYMRGLIRDFFYLYDVDGIKIDGLGQAEGEQLSLAERDTFGDVNKIRMFTMDLYRLVYQEAIKAYKDVYIESGWAVPSYANQFAHTFRYGDEFPEFRYRYPAGGLVEHIDYASLQKRILGQRPNMGMVWGGPESQRMIRLWFEAALAMGTQMTISTDLTRLSPRDLSALRSVLVHYNAFRGRTHFVGAPFANSFATTSDGMTYLGALSREAEAQEATFSLSNYGLDGDKDYLLYDLSSNSYSRVRGSFTATLSDNSFRLFLLRDSPGVMWTNSSVQAEWGDNSLRLGVDGPRSIGGFAQLFSPPPAAVRLDGKGLPRSSRLNAGNSYWYDEDTGVLRIRYRHDSPHVVEVDY